MDNEIKTSPEIALVSLAELYLYFLRRDHSFLHALGDPRTKEITEGQIIDAWEPNSVRSDEAWIVRGLGPFSLANIHYWRHQIDFHYLDVGAHVGITAIGRAIFHKRCGHDSRIFAFEPGDAFPLLEKAVQANRVSDIVTCVNAAVSDAAGQTQFYLTPGQSAASSLLRHAVHRPNVPESVATTVDTITIDAFLEAKERTNGILAKIDAEGADFTVLDGMKQTILDRVCTMQIEFFPSLVESYTDPSSRLLSLATNFNLIDVGTSPHQHIAPDRGSIDDFIARVRALSTPVTDLFLVPKTLSDADTLVDRIISD